MDLAEIRERLHIHGDPDPEDECKICGKDLREVNAFGVRANRRHWQYRNYCHKCGRCLEAFQEAIDKKNLREYHAEEARKAKEAETDLF